MSPDLGDPQAPQPVANALAVLVLLDPKLSVLGAVPDLSEVTVDPLDQRVTAVPQLAGDGVRGDGEPLIERL